MRRRVGNQRKRAAVVAGGRNVAATASEAGTRFRQVVMKKCQQVADSRTETAERAANGQRAQADRWRGSAGARLAAAREVNAFWQLYAQYAPCVHGHILARVKNPTLAEDLTARTMTNVSLALRQSSGPWRGLPLAWLLTIANNFIIESRRLVHPGASELEALEPLPGAPPPDDDTAGFVLAAELPLARNRLTIEERFILRLRFTEDISYAEVADALGERESAVRRAASHALAALRQEFATQELPAPRDAGTAGG